MGRRAVSAARPGPATPEPLLKGYLMRQRKENTAPVNDLAAVGTELDLRPGPLVEVEPDQLPGFHMTRPSPPPAKPRVSGPRRVSAEVVKAETKLVNLARDTAASVAHCQATWAAKRRAYLGSLPADVRTALVAMKVLSADDAKLEPAGD